MWPAVNLLPPARALEKVTRAIGPPLQLYVFTPPDLLMRILCHLYFHQRPSQTIAFVEQRGAGHAAQLA
jgi:hypothetical protein